MLGYKQFLYFCLMNGVKRLFDFYLDSSIHIGLSVYALTYITLVLFNVSYDEAVLYFALYGTIVAYNFIKYGSSAKKYFFVNSSYKKIIQVFSFLCFGLTMFYAFKLEVLTLVFAFVIGITAMLYIIPFLPNHKNFRGFVGLKILIVSLCWAGVSVLLPLVNNNVELLQTDVFLLFLQRVLLVLILLIPFEISDLKFDAKELGTLPQRIGVKATKNIGYVWTVLLFFLEFLKDDTNATQVFIRLGLCVLLVIMIWLSDIKKSKYFSAFFVESIPIVFCIILNYSLD